jgi:hypothetical protein
MAERLRANAFGRYYVTGDCDGCGDCVAIAPMNFAWSNDHEYCAVYAQPAGAHELDLMEQVKLLCPQHAVCDDGDDLE